MRNSRPDILSRPLFILALGLLLLNDFYLKYEFSNFLTGKLSDIAGLFLFPYFLSSLRIKWTKTIYLGTTFLFIFWKSPLSQEMIIWWQAIGIGFNRVIDYTDLFALFILPVSFIYFQKQLSTTGSLSKYLTVPIGVISLFAIWATTLPREEVELKIPIQHQYELQMSKKYLFNSLHFAHGYSNNIEKNLKDSLFYLHFDIQEDYFADVTALAKIISIDSASTMIQLDTIINGYITGSLFSGVDKDDVYHFKSLSASDFEKYFENYFIVPVRNRKFGRLYYDNKDIRDNYYN